MNSIKGMVLVACKLRGRSRKVAAVLKETTDLRNQHGRLSNVLRNAPCFRIPKRETLLLRG